MGEINNELIKAVVFRCLRERRKLNLEQPEMYGPRTDQLFFSALRRLR
jgi:hypothetical protein